MYVVTANIAAFRRNLTALERRELPFATALALTRTAQDAQTNEIKMLARTLDRPTPFTLRSVAIRRATKGRPIAEVFIKDVQAGYLAIQERGGIVRPKRRALTVPAGARLNRYGNLPRGSVRRLIARPDTFSGTVGGVAGLWQRRARGRLKLLIAWEPQARYRPRLRFRETAQKTARARFAIQFSRAWATAKRTSRVLPR